MLEQISNLLFLPAPLVLGSLSLALLIDRTLGEPPARLHPVVGMGAYLQWAGERIAPIYCDLAPTPRQSRRHFLLGTAAWLLGAAGVVFISFLCLQALSNLPEQLWFSIIYAAVLAVLLKPLFAYRMLQGEVQAVAQALAQSLEAGQARLQHLVSRDTSALDAAQVMEASLETLAENFNDSVIAPIFWFCIGGLPAAALYRFANTADAMWGYRGGRQGRNWSYAGKFAARADDVLSYIPARLTALLLCLAAGQLPLRTLVGQARLTPSPNSGWPMAALALLLHVRLSKPQVYVLNAAGRAPSHADLAPALRLLRRVWWLLWLGAVLLCVYTLI